MNQNYCFNFFSIWNYLCKHPLRLSCQKHCIHHFSFFHLLSVTILPCLSILWLSLEFILYPVAIGEKVICIQSQDYKSRSKQPPYPWGVWWCKLLERAKRALEICRSLLPLICGHCFGLTSLHPFFKIHLKYMWLSQLRVKRVDSYKLFRVVPARSRPSRNVINIIILLYKFSILCALLQLLALHYFFSAPFHMVHMEDLE